MNPVTDQRSRECRRQLSRRWSRLVSPLRRRRLLRSVPLSVFGPSFLYRPIQRAREAHKYRRQERRRRASLQIATPHCGVTPARHDTVLVSLEWCVAFSYLALPPTILLPLLLHARQRVNAPSLRSLCVPVGGNPARSSRMTSHVPWTQLFWRWLLGFDEAERVAGGPCECGFNERDDTRAEIVHVHLI